MKGGIDEWGSSGVTAILGHILPWEATVTRPLIYYVTIGNRQEQRGVAGSGIPVRTVV